MSVLVLVDLTVCLVCYNWDECTRLPSIWQHLLSDDWLEDKCEHYQNCSRCIVYHSYSYSSGLFWAGLCVFFTRHSLFSLFLVFTRGTICHLLYGWCFFFNIDSGATVRIKRDLNANDLSLQECQILCELRSDLVICCPVKCSLVCVHLVLVCWWWWFDWSFTHHVAAVVTTTSVTPIKCRMETFWYQLTQVYLEKWPLKWRESILLCGLLWVWVIIHCMCWLITCEIWFQWFSWEWLIDQSPSD